MLLVHGFPESSHMWREILPPLAEAGFHAIAPDLAGFGDSEADPPGTWERQVEALERFRTAQGLEQVALVVHDWGGLIGLRWACDHPEAVNALVISDTGFFPDGQWHGLADAMRSEQGEGLVDGMSAEGLAAMLGSLSGITPTDTREYFKAFADEPRRRGMLELYRSGDFEKLAPYDGKLGELGVPTLLLWGADDPFAPSPPPSASSARSPAPSSSCSRAPATSWSTTRRSATPRRSWASSGGRARARHAELVVALGALVDGAGRVDVHGQHLPSWHGGPWTSTSARSPGASSGACAGVSVCRRPRRRRRTGRPASARG